MPKQRITTAIRDVLDAQFGFEIYIIMKEGEQLVKRFVLDEGDPMETDGFKRRLREGIKEAIQDKFLNDDSKYANGDDLANEQNCFYVIKQDDAYQPFYFLNIPENQIENFRILDKDKADAILFKLCFQRNGELKKVWAYQKIQPASIPNKQKKHFQFTIKSLECSDVFKEMKTQMFIITRKIDLLILGDEIITDDIKLMERHFGLETFLRASATRAVSSIITVGLVGNNDKLQEYVQRPNKKYAKKMMQIHKFPVATMSKEKLMERLQTVERWKNVFEIQGTQIHLRTFSDVENIIDLFTERYTKSEVTGQEYDTSVKDKAEPIEKEIMLTIDA